MTTIEERATNYAYAVAGGSPDIVLAGEAYTKGAEDEHRLLTEWHDIAEDECGMATDMGFKEMSHNAPILVFDTMSSEVYAINKADFLDWSGELFHHPRQYKWRKIHE